jgi:hypothetical protein
VYNNLFLKKSTIGDRRNYTQVEKQNSLIESNWMTKLLFVEELKSNKDNK